MKRSFPIRKPNIFPVAIVIGCAVLFLIGSIRSSPGAHISSAGIYSANWGLSLHETAKELFYTETDHTFGGGIRCSVLHCGEASSYGLSPAAPRKDPQNIITVTHGKTAKEEILTLFTSAAGEADLPEEYFPPEDGWRWTMAEKEGDLLVILSDETTIWIAEILQQKGAW